MTLDFGSFPPEVNSIRMYSGAGAEPMLAAATAWATLAADLESSAVETRALVSGIDGAWQGPSAEQMNAKVALHASWLMNQAGVAQRTAMQANAAAAAYGAAYAATVNPALVAENRAELPVLVATNLLGQNTAAIMANETEYSEFWAQDAAAMYSYASSSAQATQLPQFGHPVSAPVPVVPPSTPDASGGIVSQILSQISFDPFNDVFSGGMVTASWIAAFIQGIPAMMSVANGSNGSGGYNPAVAVANPPPPPVVNLPVEDLGAASSAVKAIPRSHRIGSLSVPPSWASAASSVDTPASSEFRPWYGATEGEGVPAMAVPMGGASATREERRQQPRYGKKLTVMTANV